MLAGDNPLLPSGHPFLFIAGLNEKIRQNKTVPSNSNIVKYPRAGGTANYLTARRVNCISKQVSRLSIITLPAFSACANGIMGNAPQRNICASLRAIAACRYCDSSPDTLRQLSRMASCACACPGISPAFHSFKILYLLACRVAQ